MLQQPLASSQIMGALLSLFGVATVLTNGSWEALWALRFNPGDLLVLAAVSLWAVYSIAGRAALRHQPTAWITGLSTMAAVPMLLAPAAWECSSIRPAVQPELFFAVLYIGVGPSFIAFLAWNEGVKRLGPNGAMAFYNTLPLYAGVLAGMGLREWPGPAVLLGGLLVVGGCLLATGFATPSADGPLRRDRR